MPKCPLYIFSLHKLNFKLKVFIKLKYIPEEMFDESEEPKLLLIEEKSDLRFKIGVPFDAPDIFKRKA